MTYYMKCPQGHAEEVKEEAEEQEEEEEKERFNVGRVFALITPPALCRVNRVASSAKGSPGAPARPPWGQRTPPRLNAMVTPCFQGHHRYCSPRHWMPLYSRHEGSRRVPRKLRALRHGQ
jgi:hypothetical protein